MSGNLTPNKTCPKTSFALFRMLILLISPEVESRFSSLAAGTHVLVTSLKGLGLGGFLTGSDLRLDWEDWGTFDHNQWRPSQHCDDMITTEKLLLHLLTLRAAQNFDVFHHHE